MRIFIWLPLSPLYLCSKSRGNFCKRKRFKYFPLFTNYAIYRHFVFFFFVVVVIILKPIYEMILFIYLYVIT